MRCAAAQGDVYKRQELDAVKPEPVLKPAAFQAAGTECFDLYFKGVRGAKIHAKLLMPQHSAGKSPALLQFHGYTGSAGPWSEKLGLSLIHISSPVRKK